jgi:hypothetical protein
MQEITEQSIIDKLNKHERWKNCRNISEVILHILDFRITDEGDTFKELVLNDIVLLSIFGKNFLRVYIKIKSIKGDATVYSWYKSESYCTEDWCFDGEVKGICLKVIDNILDSVITEKEINTKNFIEKRQKEKEMEIAVVDDFINRFKRKGKRKDKPSFWNFLFNWKKQ